MNATLTTLIARLDSPAVSRTSVIQWGCPVPSFGDLSSSMVATLGLNPSNREFVDQTGNELEGVFRRFHTLNSLGLSSWSDVDARHLRLIMESCKSYFRLNPYNAWFKRLELIVSATNASYYGGRRRACHLDLIPYATKCKWTELPLRERTSLLSAAGDSLALLLRESPVRILILNGVSVVENFENIAGVSLQKREIQAWSLTRESKSNVKGYAYRGIVDSISGVGIGHRVLVLGFNHNLQSSFGVTTEVMLSIRAWVARAAGAATP